MLRRERNVLFARQILENWWGSSFLTIRPFHLLLDRNGLVPFRCHPNEKICP